MNSTNHIYKKSSIQKNWILIDATNMVLGRMASRIAMMLKGKHKPTYAPNMDCGDNIVVINAEKVFLSGKKLDRKYGKVYYRHTGHPGGIKSDKACDILNGKYPERVIKLAVTRMLKKTALRHAILSNLYVYKGNEHPHTAQKPELLDLYCINRKNKKIA